MTCGRTRLLLLPLLALVQVPVEGPRSVPHLGGERCPRLRGGQEMHHSESMVRLLVRGVQNDVLRCLLYSGTLDSAARVHSIVRVREDGAVRVTLDVAPCVREPLVVS